MKLLKNIGLKNCVEKVIASKQTTMMKGKNMFMKKISNYKYCNTKVQPGSGAAGWGVLQE